MNKTLLTVASLLIVHAPIVAQETTSIPGDVKGHMKSMVGSWTFQGKDGDRKFSGQETIRLASNGTALLQEGYYDLGGGKKEHYVILSGWNGDSKLLGFRNLSEKCE